MIPLKRQLLAALAAVAASGVVAAGVPAAAGPTSGVDMSNADLATRAQDDFYQYVNGGWLKKAEIPADKARWGAFDELRESVLPQLRALIDAANAAPDRAAGSDQQKIGDLYASFMNQARRDTLGRAPLAAEFARIAAVQDKKQLPALMAYFNKVGVSSPLGLGVSQDGRDATRYAVIMAQGGLGLPDRDYYLKDDDVKLKEARIKYQALIEDSLAQGGEADAAATARDILALETALAKVQWTKVENRNPVKSYNKLGLAELEQLAPGFDWKAFADATGISPAVNYVIVRQPSYFTGFARIMQDTPLPVWQAYFRWHVINRYSAFLGTNEVERDFAFYSATLRGIPANEPEWKRGVRLVEGGTGEILGKLYVEKYFPPENKARMEKLVANLLAAYKQSIDTLDWMSPATKKEAQAKLATFAPKIGYPAKWRDYTKLAIDKDDLIGNVQRISVFNHERQMAKLGKPIDRAEWGMTPQTVNAYYNPQKNEIVFPAAILQPPFFDARADDAVNYGGIGAVIGHEISHGFDDQGSQFDEVGNLRDWWTKEDGEKFMAKAAVVGKQFDAFSPMDSVHVNGNLTMGENLADLGGLTIAHQAFQKTAQAKAGKSIDGFTPEQRFFLGYAQIWRSNQRPEAMRQQIMTDPHSPGQYRTNGPLQNMPEFHQAFGCKDGDKMVRSTADRAKIW